MTMFVFHHSQLIQKDFVQLTSKYNIKYHATSNFGFGKKTFTILTSHEARRNFQKAKSE